MCAFMVKSWCVVYYWGLIDNAAKSERVEIEIPSSYYRSPLEAEFEAGVSASNSLVLTPLVRRIAFLLSKTMTSFLSHPFTDKITTTRIEAPPHTDLVSIGLCEVRWTGDDDAHCKNSRSISSSDDNSSHSSGSKPGGSSSGSVGGGLLDMIQRHLGDQFVEV